MGDSLQDLINKVEQWGHERNLNAPENLKAQTMKLVSEFGEIGAGFAKDDDIEIIDGIGDTLIVAIIIGRQLGLPITSSAIQTRQDSCGVGYERASGRLGLFVDGVLKSYPSEQLRALLDEFVGAVCDFIQDWDFGSHAPSLELCLETVYNEIKDRKGVMFQGAFIKESDPQFAEASALIGAKDRYRKKPVVVEAISFDQLVEVGYAQCDCAAGGMPWSFSYKGHAITHENDDCYLIPTLEGTMKFERGAMLITGIKGEIYPCAGDIFAATYEAA